MPQIELRGLTKAFKTGRVLDGVSLSVETGEIVVIFGPSGTGKTVLLRLVAGVEEPDAGAVILEGRDVTDASPETRGIGMAFQNFALFPHMAAYDNIASALTARGTSGAEIRARVEKVAQLLKITHVLQHQPRELSNGQKQRTALARALAADPRVLLLDDPLRNVDAKLRYEMRLELPALLKGAGSTVLYVTQDYKEAMALGDRIAVLLDGTFAQVAAPAEIYRAPATLGVARLFGDPILNLVPVTPEAGGNGPTVAIGGVTLTLPPGYAAAAGRGCILGLRPETLTAQDAPSADSFPVDILAVTPLNEKTVLLARTAEGREILIAEAGDVETPRRPGPAHARFDARSILLFDAAGGSRIASQAE